MMFSYTMCNIAIHATSAAIMLVFLVGCQRKPPPGPPITSWTSPRMLEVQKEWESVRQQHQNTYTKAEYADRCARLTTVIANNLSDEDMKRLAATCDSLLIRYQDRSEFANNVLDYMIMSFLSTRDRDSLVTVLSKRYQPRMALDNIELILVSSGTRIKDPILVLSDAYVKCKTPEGRRSLASAVRRAFAGHKIEGKDDTEFVNNAMQWYEKEKDHLKVNYYGYATATQPLPPEQYEEHPELYEKIAKYEPHWLFQKKPTDK
jgi:hypothetical protein